MMVVELFVLGIVVVVALFLHRRRAAAASMYTAPTSKADFVFNGGGQYLAIHLADQLLAVKGRAASTTGKAYKGNVPFAQLRRWGTFSEPEMLVNITGLQLEIADLQTPIVKIRMNGDAARVWQARLSEALRQSGLNVT